MKRSVAIYGPTPQYIRWAISHECPLRDLDAINLPDFTFRQLRGLREYSVGLIENRVIEGFCVHPTASLSDIDGALGFAGSEVTCVHGDDAVVAGCCGQCPANALSLQRKEIWAGCYGWLAATSSFCFDSILKQANPPADIPTESTSKLIEIDFVQLLDETIERLGKSGEADDLFKPTSPRWYGIWNSPTLNGKQVDFLVDVFDQMVLACSELEPVTGSIDELVSMGDALRSAAEAGLTLHIDLVPPGYSDGQTWTLAAHCPECKCRSKAENSQQKCEACGRTGNPHGESKSKVLGLRPYVQLSGVLGKEQTAKLLERYDALVAFEE
jgi:hypothetical protein